MSDMEIDGTTHPDFYCEECQKNYRNKSQCQFHMKDFHTEKSDTDDYYSDNDTSYSRNKKKPDIYDPNHHCSVCNRNYSSRQTYRNHLQYMHYMSVPRKRRTIHKKSSSKSSSLSSLYCNACRRLYASKPNYMQHLKRQQHIMQQAQLEKIPHDPKFYCPLCNVQTTNEQYLEAHQKSKRHHYYLAKKRKEKEGGEKTNNKSKQQQQQDKENEKTRTLPGEAPNRFLHLDNLTDSHCHLCNQSFIWNFMYRRHLNTVHDMDLDVDEPKEVPPSAAAESTTGGGQVNASTATPSKFDQIERTFYCVTCNMTFSKKTDYWNHLDMAHFKSSYGSHL